MRVKHGSDHADHLLQHWPTPLLERNVLKKLIMKRITSFQQLSRLSTSTPTYASLLGRTTSWSRISPGTQVGVLLASASIQQASCSMITSQLIKTCLQTKKKNISTSNQTLDADSRSLFTYFHIHGNFFRASNYDEDEDEEEAGDDDGEEEAGDDDGLTFLRKATINEEVDEDDALRSIGTGEEYEVGRSESSLFGSTWTVTNSIQKNFLVSAGKYLELMALIPLIAPETHAALVELLKLYITTVMTTFVHQRNITSIVKLHSRKGGRGIDIPDHSTPSSNIRDGSSNMNDDNEMQVLEDEGMTEDSVSDD